MTVLPFNRQPQGIPTGGQFAATSHSEAPVSLGRHAALIGTREVPETLRMAHFQDPNLVPSLEWQIRQSESKDDFELDYASDQFHEELPNLNVEEAYGYFSRAREAFLDGCDWQAVVADAAAADTAAHPGGSLTGDYSPPLTRHQAGYQQGTLVTGSRYTGWRDAAEIAKDVRTELKKATAANYLPKGVSYSVRIDKYSGGQAINIDARGTVDADRLDPDEVDHYGNPRHRPEATELLERLDGILAAYNRTDIDGQVDYYDVAFSARTSIETDRQREWRLEEAAKSAERRARKAS